MLSEWRFVCCSGLFAQADLVSDENGVGVELLNDEVQCVHFGCGVELNRFFTIDSNNNNR